jgi:hypothetical protein
MNSFFGSTLRGTTGEIFEKNETQSLLQWDALSDVVFHADSESASQYSSNIASSVRIGSASKENSTSVSPALSPGQREVFGPRVFSRLLVASSRAFKGLSDEPQFGVGEHCLHSVAGRVWQEGSSEYCHSRHCRPQKKAKEQLATILVLAIR